MKPYHQVNSLIVFFLLLIKFVSFKKKMECHVTNSVVLSYLLYNIPSQLPKSTPAEVPKCSCAGDGRTPLIWRHCHDGSAKRDSQLLGCALFWHLRHQPPPCSPVCKTTLLLAPSDLISPVYIAREATRGLLAANMKVLVSLCVFVPLLALATAGKSILQFAQFSNTDLRWGLLCEVVKRVPCPV